MSKKLYVGNLPYSATDQALITAFSECGAVESAKVVIDRDSGRSKGFAFVEMGSEADAAKVIEKYHEADWDGRAMNVAIAKPMAPRENRTGGGGGFNRGARGGW
ncbi:MAG: RNA recognition motif domain-containing protein [Pseudobdellovibrionaceae bacterium]